MCITAHGRETHPNPHRPAMTTPVGLLLKKGARGLTRTSTRMGVWVIERWVWRATAREDTILDWVGAIEREVRDGAPLFCARCGIDLWKNPGRTVAVGNPAGPPVVRRGRLHYTHVWLICDCHAGQALPLTVLRWRAVEARRGCVPAWVWRVALAILLALWWQAAVVRLLVGLRGWWA